MLYITDDIKQGVMILKKLHILALALGLLGNSAFAGIVVKADITKAFSDTTYAKGILTALEKEIKPQQTKLEALGKEIETITQNAEKNAKIMSEADRKALQAKYTPKAAEYQSLQKGIETRLQNTQNTILNTLVPKVDKLVPEMCKELGYDMLIDSKYVIWSVDTLDITAEVTKRLNAMP